MIGEESEFRTKLSGWKNNGALEGIKSIYWN
jgi:hypothetical protein